ncbi:hypothetical protein [Micromonospora sp. S-DT3-3-22]|uniref:hypothetical protein n=1 Tax=Micromonospora sp. S-DT3-3-22 TaxID=2755359 RepID=UPI00188FF382|nr:hypothetical protein [Micromonospora sp. S-DT3-3-22]
MKIEDLVDGASIGSMVISLAVGLVAWLGWRTSVGVRRDQVEAEERRRHREMRPVLEVLLGTRGTPEPALLVVKLIGPREVEQYDWIRLAIRDDGKNRTPHGDVTTEAIREQVWGPFRLRPGVDGADREGRAAQQDARAVTDSWLFTVDRSTPPRWYGGGDVEWRKDYAGKPVRLRIEIGLGKRSWSELVEVPTAREVSRKARFAD